MLDRVVSDSVSLGKRVQTEGICGNFHRKEGSDPCNLLPANISTQMLYQFVSTNKAKHPHAKNEVPVTPAYRLSPTPTNS